jgi:hypothetical protein
MQKLQWKDSNTTARTGKKGGVIVYLRNYLARSTVELRSKSGNSDGFVEHVLLHIKKLTCA